MPSVNLLFYSHFIVNTLASRSESPPTSANASVLASNIKSATIYTAVSVGKQLITYAVGASAFEC